MKLLPCTTKSWAKIRCGHLKIFRKQTSTSSTFERFSTNMCVWCTYRHVCWFPHIQQGCSKGTRKSQGAPASKMSPYLAKVKTHGLLLLRPSVRSYDNWLVELLGSQKLFMSQDVTGTNRWKGAAGTSRKVQPRQTGRNSWSKNLLRYD